MTRLFYLELSTELELFNMDSNFMNNLITMRYLSYLTLSKDLTLGLILAFVCFNSFSYISYNEITHQIILTFQQCYRDLMAFFVVFVSLLLCYIFVLGNMLGPHLHSFSTFARSLASLFALFWGDLDFERINEFEPSSFFVIVLYLIVVVIVMFNLILAIILGNYDKIRTNPKLRNLHEKLGDKFYAMINTLIITLLKK